MINYNIYNETLLEDNVSLITVKIWLSLDLTDFASVNYCLSNVINMYNFKLQLKIILLFSTTLNNYNRP